MTDVPKPLGDDNLREAIGRAWCHEGNTHKVVDPDLAEAVLYEVRAALAEQAAPAGVRVKPLIKLFIDDDGDICHEPSGADMNLVALPAVDDDGRVMHPDLFRAMVDAYNAAIEPDPMPALSWRAMQMAAAYAARNACLVPPDGGSPTETESAVCIEAEWRIKQIPGPTDADLDREALNRPVVQGLVTDMRELREVVQNISGEDALDRELIRAAEARIDAALAKIGGDA